MHRYTITITITPDDQKLIERETERLRKFISLDPRVADAGWSVEETLVGVFFEGVAAIRERYRREQQMGRLQTDVERLLAVHQQREKGGE